MRQPERARPEAVFFADFGCAFRFHPQKPNHPGVANGDETLAVMLRNGARAQWSNAEEFNLTYCVSLALSWEMATAKVSSSMVPCALVYFPLVRPFQLSLMMFVLVFPLMGTAGYPLEPIVEGKV